MKENADKHRALDTAEIEKNFRESAEQMFRLRFQMALGQMEGLKKYRSMRRDRARMLTVLREREMHPDTAVKTPAAPAPKKAAAKSAAAKATAKTPAKSAAKKSKG